MRLNEGKDKKEVVTPVESLQSSPVLAGSQGASLCPSDALKGGKGDLTLENLPDYLRGKLIPGRRSDRRKCLVDLGIDEILMLFIAGRCKEIFGLGVSTSTTIADVHTVKDVKKSGSVLVGDVRATMGQGDIPNQCAPSAYAGSRRHSPEEVAPQDHVTSDSSQASTPQMSGTPPAGERECSAATRGSTGTATTSRTEEEGSKPKPAFVNIRSASSILLQKRPQADKKTLFLFAAGAGLASSHSNPPKMNNDLTIVGLKSPYARFPEEMTRTLAQLLDAYIADLRRRPPAGPYNFGG